MAHKSKKKHIKHAHQHDHDVSQPRHPGAKATSAALGSETSHKSRLTSKAKEAARVAARARVKKPTAASAANARATGKPVKRKGVVRRIASAASEKLTAKPKRIISKARARVRSLLGRVAAKPA